MNSYNYKKHYSNINNYYNKTASTKWGEDLIIISLVVFPLFDLICLIFLNSKLFFC